MLTDADGTDFLIDKEAFSAKRIVSSLYNCVEADAYDVLSLAYTVIDINLPIIMVFKLMNIRYKYKKYFDIIKTNLYFYTERYIGL